MGGRDCGHLEGRREMWRTPFPLSFHDITLVAEVCTVKGALGASKRNMTVLKSCKECPNNLLRMTSGLVLMEVWQGARILNLSLYLLRKS